LEPPKVTDGVNKVPRVLKNQRKSRAGKRKGCYSKAEGNKVTSNYQEEEPGFLDDRDPNYDSETQGEVRYVESIPKLDVGEFECEAERILSDLWSDSCISEAVTQTKDLNLTERAKSDFIRFVIVDSIDQVKSSHRETASEFLAELRYCKIFDIPLYVAAIFAFFDQDLPDLSIDYADCCTILGNFIARLTADECLPEDFRQKCRNKIKEFNSQDLVSQVLSHADAVLVDRKRLDRVWGVGGGARPLNFIRTQMYQIGHDYLLNSDLDEASRCVNELEVPHFSHEMVYQIGLIVIFSMEESAARKMTVLIDHLFKSDQLTVNQIITGLNRLYLNIPELLIDMPGAYQTFNRWLNFIKDHLNCIPNDVFDGMPEKKTDKVLRSFEFLNSKEIAEIRNILWAGNCQVH
uniref:Programmed cell death protein 4 n=1 Tax=Romanomermis culicivorax TaxID=13658 RepID=A0A915IYT6_ROMCU